MKTYIINIKTREDRRLLMDIQLRANGFEIEEEGKNVKTEKQWQKYCAKKK